MLQSYLINHTVPTVAIMKLTTIYTSNKNGSRMLNFCRDNDLCISNSWFSHKFPKRITYISPDGKTRKTL